MLLPRIFGPFVEQSPASIMGRAILEYALPPEEVDQLFGQHSVRQYEDQLLFSTVVEVLSLAVAGTRKSVNASYETLREKVQVSVTSLQQVAGSGTGRLSGLGSTHGPATHASHRLPGA